MVKILTSSFDNGFPEDFARYMLAYIKPGMSFVFVASEFMNIYEKTDSYFHFFLNMFSEIGIIFGSAKVIDGRMSKEEAQDCVKNADVIWLAGGDTPTQFSYLKSYGLIDCIKENRGIIIGMSAGAINMAKTAICTLTCGHDELKIYEGLGLVDFSIEPHFDKNNISKELLELSDKYSIYGICEDSAIICTDDEKLIIGDVYLIENGHAAKV